jgi:hypothetical protein
MIKYLWKKIDWTVVQVVILVGMLPVMLVIGALFYQLFSAKYR